MSSQAEKNEAPSLGVGVEADRQPLAVSYMDDMHLLELVAVPAHSLLLLTPVSNYTMLLCVWFL